MDTQELYDLTTARKELIPRSQDGKPIAPSTLWRWVRKGLEGIDGERIRLPVKYCGHRPFVTADDINSFFQAVTEAKLERHRRTEEQAADVTDAELESAGLQ